MLSALASGGVLFLLDRWSKKAAQLHVEGHFVSWGPFLRIRYVTHLRQYYKRENAKVALLLLWLVSLGCALVLRHSGSWFQSSVAQIGLGLAFGGAAGNLLDVLQSEHIVNFVDLRWWPVFNLADFGIVAGLLLAFLT
jgi:lipoprotein signal peptidase